MLKSLGEEVRAIEGQSEDTKVWEASPGVMVQEGLCRTCMLDLLVFSLRTR